VSSKTFHMKCYLKINRWVFEMLLENEEMSKYAMQQQKRLFTFF